MHARLQTCFEVGGDLYDFHIREDGRLVFVVGDVSGKGMGAALLMSSVLSSSRVLYDACELCRVDVAKSSVPVWARTSKDDRVFFVRMNNSTRAMPEGESNAYIAER